MTTCKQLDLRFMQWGIANLDQPLPNNHQSALLISNRKESHVPHPDLRVCPWDIGFCYKRPLGKTCLIDDPNRCIKATNRIECMHLEDPLPFRS